MLYCFTMVIMERILIIALQSNQGNHATLAKPVCINECGTVKCIAKIFPEVLTLKLLLGLTTFGHSTKMVKNQGLKTVSFPQIFVCVQVKKLKCLVKVFGSDASLS